MHNTMNARRHKSVDFRELRASLAFFFAVIETLGFSTATTVASSPGRPINLSVVPSDNLQRFTVRVH